MFENSEKNKMFAKLLDQRTILLFGELTEKKAEKIIGAMLVLQEENSDPIKLIINCSGGIETEILAVYDAMRHLSCEVETLCIGKAHGLSALLLAGGSQGKRAAYANAEIMLMQVGRDRTFGQASDIELETEHLLASKKRVNALLAEACGKNKEELAADLERKYWLFAEDAKAYGLIDTVIE